LFLFHPPLSLSLSLSLSRVQMGERVKKEDKEFGRQQVAFARLPAREKTRHEIIVSYISLY
jgi:hypothetical protein